MEGTFRYLLPANKVVAARVVRLLRGVVVASAVWCGWVVWVGGCGQWVSLPPLPHPFQPVLASPAHTLFHVSPLLLLVVVVVLVALVVAVGVVSVQASQASGSSSKARRRRKGEVVAVGLGMCAHRGCLLPMIGSSWSD